MLCEDYSRRLYISFLPANVGLQHLLTRADFLDWSIGHNNEDVLRPAGPYLLWHDQSRGQDTVWFEVKILQALNEEAFSAPVPIICKAQWDWYAEPVDTQIRVTFGDRTIIQDITPNQAQEWSWTAFATVATITFDPIKMDFTL